MTCLHAWRGRGCKLQFIQAERHNSTASSLSLRGQAHKHVGDRAGIRRPAGSRLRPQRKRVCAGASPADACPRRAGRSRRAPPPPPNTSASPSSRAAPAACARRMWDCCGSRAGGWWHGLRGGLAGGGHDLVRELQELRAILGVAVVVAAGSEGRLDIRRELGRRGEAAARELLSDHRVVGVHDTQRVALWRLAMGRTCRVIYTRLVILCMDNR